MRQGERREEGEEGGTHLNHVVVFEVLRSGQGREDARLVGAEGASALEREHAARGSVAIVQGWHIINCQHIIIRHTLGINLRHIINLIPGQLYLWMIQSVGQLSNVGQLCGINVGQLNPTPIGRPDPIGLRRLRATVVVQMLRAPPLVQQASPRLLRQLPLTWRSERRACDSKRNEEAAFRHSVIWSGSLRSRVRDTAVTAFARLIHSPLVGKIQIPWRRSPTRPKKC